jgi:hypothetical protein
LQFFTPYTHGCRRYLFPPQHPGFGVVELSHNCVLNVVGIAYQGRQITGLFISQHLTGVAVQEFSGNKALITAADILREFHLQAARAAGQ